MIVHFIEVWLLLAAAFVVGGIVGVLVYEGLARTSLAAAQIAVADAVAAVAEWITGRFKGGGARRRSRRRLTPPARPVARPASAPRHPEPEPVLPEDDEGEDALTAWFEENAELEEEDTSAEEVWDEPPPPPAAAPPVRPRTAGGMPPRSVRPLMPPPIERAPPPERPPLRRPPQLPPPAERAPPPARPPLRRPPQLPPPAAYGRAVVDEAIDEMPLGPDSADMRRPAMLAEPRNGVPDNLQRIRGIGERNEVRLNKLGIFHFSQIAAWTPAEIRWIGRYLAFPERIDRDDWVGQAVVLASGGETGFTKASERRRERRRLTRGGEVDDDDPVDPDDEGL